ncbi:MAG: MerR family transcriptional regulator [Terriglobia bacterium]
MRSVGLKRYIGKTFTVEELVLQAAKLVEQLVGEQARYNVTQSPDVRTIRFYQSEGVLDKPIKRHGTKAIYGYRHLLQLLAVKRMQADSLPIRLIKEMIRDKDDRALEELILERSKGRGKEAKTTLEYSVLAENIRSSPEFEGLRSPRARYAAGEADYTRMTAGDADLSEKRKEWVRYEVEDGLELSIRDGYRAPESSFGQMILVAKVKEALNDFLKRRKQQ